MNILKNFFAWWKRFTGPTPRRMELRYLPYAAADKLMRESNGAWTIAPEEDANVRIGWVYLERLEIPTTPRR